MNEILEKETSEKLDEELDFVEKYTLTFENAPEIHDEEKENVELGEDEHIEECTSLVEIKEHRLFVIQNMFKKSIRVSLKSFLISLSLSFLNLFI